jgi:hypothetical protein
MDLGYGGYSSFSGMGSMGETSKYESIDKVRKQPLYRVAVPFGAQILWPSRCSLCCKPSVAGNKEIKTKYRSAEYGVASKNTTITIPGLPYCEDCLKRISHTRSEGVVALIGLGIGFVIFLAMAIMIPGGWCMGALMGGVFGLCFFPIARLFLKNKAEEPSAKMDVGTEQKLVGKNRVKHYRFKFRNLRYAYEFAYKNNSILNSVCDVCGNDLVKGPESIPFCVNCDKKKT